MGQTKLNKFRNLFDLYDLRYQGVQMNRVICVELWHFANHEKRYGLQKYLRNIFCCKNVYRMDTSAEILSTCGSNGRKDHMDLYKQVIMRISDRTKFNDPDSWGEKLCCHPLMIFKILIKSFSLLKSSNLSAREKFDMTTEVIYYCNTLLALNQLDFSYTKKYVCEIDVRHFENLLTQYMKLRDIPTFSMEEGLFYIFKGEIPHDAVHYEVLTTDRLLCWSQYVIDEYSQFGIEKKRLVLAGYPKLVDLRIMHRFSSSNNCIVLVARAQFDDANIKLINILKSLSHIYNFSLKLHPSCNFNKYKELVNHYNISIISKEKTINDCLKQGVYDWAIAVNTTAYYEALMRGVPCLRFTDPSYFLPKGGDDTFNSKETLILQIKKLSKINVCDYQQEVDNILKYTMGIGIDNYRNILVNYE